MIYLDYASNTPVDPQVSEAFFAAEKHYIGNPNSKHSAGRLAAEKMNETTHKIAELLQVKPSEMIYTSGASEGNNLALKGMARSYRHKGKHIISTCLEHSSVSGTLTYLQEQGFEIELVDILPDGTVDLLHLKELMRDDTIIVSICYTDSELGTIQPVSSIGEILKSYPNCRFHSDATQAVGKIPVSFDKIDCAVFAPHKFYGLNGCGLLIKKEDVILEPIIHGGASTTMYRSGTPSLALAVSTLEALQISYEHLAERKKTVEEIKSYLLKRLKQYPLVKINSSEKTVPHIINVSVTGVKGETFQQALDKAGICVSTKSACSVPHTPSRPVYAVSKNRKNALNSWRISLSHLTSKEEVEAFISAFDNCYKELTK